MERSIRKAKMRPWNGKTEGGRPMDGRESPTVLIFDALPHPFGRWPRTAWVALAVLYLVLSLVCFHSTGFLPLVAMTPFLCVPIAFVPWAMGYGHRALVEWRKTVDQFVEGRKDELDYAYREELAAYASQRSAIVGGIALTIVAVPINLVALRSVPGFPPDWVSTVVILIVLLHSTFFGGAALHCLFRVTSLVRRIGGFPVRVQDHPFGIASTGSLLLRCHAVAAAVIIFFFMSSLGLRWHYLPTVALGATVPCTLLVLFILALFPLHRSMIEYKADLLRRMEERIREAFERTFAEPDSESREKLAFFQGQHDRIKELPEWPCHWQSFVATCATAASTAIPTILQGVIQEVVFPRLTGSR